MSEYGHVTGIDGEFLAVSLKRASACAKCRACVVGMGSKEMTLRVKNACGATVGDTVAIVVDTKFALKAVLILYGVPFLFLAAGLALGYGAAVWANAAAWREWLSFGFGLAGMLLAYKLIKSRDKRAGPAAHMPTAVRVLSD